MLSFYDQDPRRPVRAAQIWNILIGKSYNRQTMTYGELAEILGYEGAGVFAQILGHIMHFCIENDLPPLTSLVVNERTGLPGDGLIVEDLHSKREQVYSYQWYRLVPPTAQELEEVVPD